MPALQEPHLVGQTVPKLTLQREGSYGLISAVRGVNRVERESNSRNK